MLAIGDMNTWLYFPGKLGVKYDVQCNGHKEGQAK